MGKFQDLTGQTFGYWTVIEKDCSPKSKKTYWICKCKCGKIKSVRSDVLKRNNQSCGCVTKERMKNQTIDLTGQRFGMLIVLNQVKREDVKTKDSFWLCQCDCGNICTVQVSNLKSGATKSCGCNHKSFGEQKIAQLPSEMGEALVVDLVEVHQLLIIQLMVEAVAKQEHHIRKMLLFMELMELLQMFIFIQEMEQVE